MNNLETNRCRLVQKTTDIISAKIESSINEQFGYLVAKFVLSFFCSEHFFRSSYIKHPVYFRNR